MTQIRACTDTRRNAWDALSDTFDGLDLLGFVCEFISYATYAYFFLDRIEKGDESSAIHINIGHLE